MSRARVVCVVLAVVVVWCVVGCGGADSAWSTDTQDAYMAGCALETYGNGIGEELGFENVVNLCRCLLDGQMDDHAEAAFLSWDKPVRDAAIAPYGVECWPTA